MLHDLSFRAAPGEITAIVGSTGSGKTTLINLIPRFYDVTAGSVLVDGVDVRDREREQLWARVAMVPQKAFLFAGTVASNLRFGDADASDEQREGRAHDGGADFVAAMPDGLDSPITQGGSNVSAVSASVAHRPGHRPTGGHRRLRRQLLGARRGDRCPTPRRARREAA